MLVLRRNLHKAINSGIEPSSGTAAWALPAVEQLVHVGPIFAKVSMPAAKCFVCTRIFHISFNLGASFVLPSHRSLRSQWDEKSILRQL